MEQKKMAEAQKGIRKYERRIKELSYQVWQHQAQLQPSRTWANSPCAQILVLSNIPLLPSPAQPCCLLGAVLGPTRAGQASPCPNIHHLLSVLPLWWHPYVVGNDGRPGGYGAGAWLGGAAWYSLCVKGPGTTGTPG